MVYSSSAMTYDVVDDSFRSSLDPKPQTPNLEPGTLNPKTVNPNPQP